MDNGIIAFLIILGMVCVVTIILGILDYLKSKK
jgi:preprotein translocase subunit SecE